MRSKTNLKQSFPPSSPALPPLWHRKTGNGDYAQFIHHVLFLPLLPQVGEVFPGSVMGPSHRKQSSINFSSVGSFHGVQSRNRLFQCRSSTGSLVLSTNLLQCGLLLPRVHMSLPGAWIQCGLPVGSQTSFVHPPAPVWVCSVICR